MKQNRYFLSLLILVLLFSCGKTILPSDNKEEDEIEKQDSSSSPDELDLYTISEFIEGDFGNREVWVHGYIVGACKRPSQPIQQYS